MKKLIIFIFGFLMFSSMYAQTLFFEVNNQSFFNFSNKQKKLIEKIKSKPNVDNVYSISIQNDIHNSTLISFNINGKKIIANKLRIDERSKGNYTWFGKTTDGEGVFFCVNNQKIASKISVGDFAYNLIPLDNNNHILVEFNSTYVGDCSDSIVSNSSLNRSFTNDELESDDPDCTLRLLLAVTPIARQEIIESGFDIPTFGQIAIDETNMAYILSQIDLIIELAVLIDVNYIESMGNGHLTDVRRFERGTNGLNVLHDLRETYQTDIQVLIRRNEPRIFGRAAYVASRDNPLNESRAFCTVAVNGITDGRFSFAHEIGHLQGARHENHNTAPDYARGFLFATGVNRLRTIMTRTGAARCSLSTSCRISMFSNPNIIGPGGVTIGTNDRNNSRNINETSFEINNFRQTPNIHVLTINENIEEGQASNHFGKLVIDTNDRFLTYRNGSESTMRANKKIILKPGITIERGARFKAYISNSLCNEVSTSIRRSAKQLTENTEIVSTALVDESISVSIYPNPTSRFITLSSKKLISSWELMDINGKLVMSDKSNKEVSQTKIDLEGLGSDLYILKTTFSDNSFSITKLIKN